MYGDEPGGDEVDKVMEEVGVGDAIDGGVDSEEKEQNIGYVAETVNGWVVRYACSWASYGPIYEKSSHLPGGHRDTYFEVTLGTIFPHVKVSTSIMNGIIDKTLWCDENGVNQCTARLCTQTSRTGILIGKTQSIRIRIE